ncbi:MAG: FtsX-like permease family protein [Spirochaetaceae bacterium]
MLSIKTKKVVGDLKTYKSRYILMTLALSISLFAVTTLLSSYSILTREIAKNYLSTNPAHITFEIDVMTLEQLKKLENINYVDTVELRDAFLFQVQNSKDDWVGLRTFVIQDFENMKLAKIFKESGSWPPKTGEVLIERTVPELLGKNIGSNIRVKNLNGDVKELIVSGTIHDPSLSPSSQEQTGYAYITINTLKYITGDSTLHDLKITLKGEDFTHQEIKDKSLDIVSYLSEENISVSEVLVPPPYRHPHQGQIESILSLFIFFGFLAILLSAILTSEMVSTLMEKEIRQIGILKTIGAKTSQVFTIYLSCIFIVCLISIFLGIIPGVVIGKGFSALISGLLNFKLYSLNIPVWVYVTLIVSGLLIPLTICLIPLISASRMSIKKAITSNGISTVNVKNRENKKSILPSFIQMSLRNTFRKKGRLFLSLLLLSVAGAVFMTSKNVTKAWDYKIENSLSGRTWDLDLKLIGLEDKNRVINLLENIPQLSSIEPVLVSTISVYTKNAIKISETYPDGGHGVFYLKSLVQGSELFNFKILEGSWLTGTDYNTIVLNQKARELFPNSKIGESISIYNNNQILKYRLVGVIEEIGPATSYVTSANIIRANSFLINYNNSLDISEEVLILEIEKRLRENDIKILLQIPESTFRDAINGHIFIIIYSLFAMGIILAIVGILGLSSSITSNVLERKSEFGILKTIGASNSKILIIVLIEATLITFLSIICGIIISLPLSYNVGQSLGQMAFNTPLDLYLSVKGTINWSILIIVSSFIASLFPALTAVEMTVKETLACE